MDMKLIEFRAANGISRSRFAAMIGVSEVSVYRYEQGRVPTNSVLERIFRATDGAVGPNDFHDFAAPDGAAA